MLPEIEIAEIAAPEPSIVAAYLNAPLVAYQGVLAAACVHEDLDARRAETEALLRGAGVHDLGWLRRVAVRGEDRFRWLSGMVTNGVETLATGSGAYNLVLNAQGRIQGDAVVWRVGDPASPKQDALMLEMTAAQMPALMAHFDHFIVMDDVELVALEGQSAIGLTGPGAEAVLVALGLPALAENTLGPAAKVGEIAVQVARGYGSLAPHYELWAEAGEIPALWEQVVAAGAVPAGVEALETLRIVEGIALYGTDIESRDLPQETAQTRALHYTKGCYLGQEIVERIRSRGQVHRHLRQLELTVAEGGEMPGPGTEVRKDNAAEDAKPAATITSITRTPDGRVFALGVVRAEAEVGNPTLIFPGGTARVLAAPPQL